MSIFKSNNHSIFSKSGEIEPTAKVQVSICALGNGRRVTSGERYIQTPQDIMIYKYLDSLGLEEYQVDLHYNSLIDLYKIYHSKVNHIDSLQRLQNFINTVLRRRDNINKLTVGDQAID